MNSMIKRLLTNPTVTRSLRVFITLAMIVLAGVSGRWLWLRYNRDPWTRDGRLRADVVLVSPDVSGLVTSVSVKDGQMVHKGDLLFVIDPSRRILELAQAKAAVAADEAQLAEAEREAKRNRELGNLATKELSEETDAKVLSLVAALNGAKATEQTAKLNLERTEVRSTVNGTVTNLELQPGDYAAVGRQFLAIVNSDSLYADGYFEETKLPEIRVGDVAFIHLMGVDASIRGRVESVAAGIEDRERAASSNDLANINPTFSWVRLAQRIPVRTRLEQVPRDVRLIAGRTATISIAVPRGRKLEGAV